MDGTLVDQETDQNHMDGTLVDQETDQKYMDAALLSNRLTKSTSAFKYFTILFSLQVATSPLE